jgi:pimeloyl-ACP methyl ester carboxylesterase
VLRVAVQPGTLKAGGSEIYVVRAGPEQGPPVVLLHDFGQYWAAWARQLEGLASAGFRVLAIDEPGHHRSTAGSSASPDGLSALAADVAALIRNSGYRRVTLVGHGAGGVVAWQVALQFPARLDKLVILAAPHPAVSPAPGSRVGWLPRLEAAAPALEDGGEGAAGALFRLFASTARPVSFTRPDLVTLRGTWGDAAGIRRMIEWQRAVETRPTGAAAGADARIDVDTLLLWGSEDPVYPVELAAPSRDLCVAAELHVLSGAGHWLPQEAADEVDRRLRAFLAR